jgi:AcrR family transcriptional regulator
MTDKRTQSHLRSDLVMEKIVASAAQLFAQRGYRATTLRDIANQLGMSKAALYHYIQSKEDLLQPVYIDVLQEGMAELQAIVSSTAPPGEKLSIAIERHMQRIATKPAMFALSLQTNEDLPENSRQVIGELRDTSTNLFCAIIAEGVACGEMHTAEPKMAALGLLGMLNWTQRWFRPEGRLDYHQIAEVFIHLLLRGLLGPGDEAPKLANTPSEHLQAIRLHVDALTTLLQNQGMEEGGVRT